MNSSSCSGGGSCWSLPAAAVAMAARVAMAASNTGGNPYIIRL